MSLPNDSIKKVLLVSIGLCIGCSVLVSTVTVALKSRQEANATNDRRKNILVAAGLAKREDKNVDIDGLFKNICRKLIDIDTGEEVTGQDPDSFDFQLAMKDPKATKEIPTELDTGGIKRRPKQATVYLVQDAAGKTEVVVLPIVGKGLWSTMWGFLALEKDLSTVRGLVYYEQKETPGLGGEVDNPQWLAQWPGKELFQEDGSYDFAVLKGQIPPDSPKKNHLADGISGATITIRGVSGTLKYWMGEDGFGPYLKKLGGRGNG